MKATALEMGVLEGPPEKMVFSCCLDLLRHEKYKMAGQFVYWSLMNGGPGLPVLHPAVYDFWVGVNVQHIYDFIRDLDGPAKDVGLQVPYTVSVEILPN